MIGKLTDLGHEPGGGDGEMAGPDTQPPWRGDQLEGLQQITEIRKRFAHSHENDVVDLLPTEVLSEENLSGDFIRDEIAREAVQARGAEPAAEGTTYLRRNAQGTAVGLLAEERG